LGIPQAATIDFAKALTLTKPPSDVGFAFSARLRLGWRLPGVRQPVDQGFYKVGWCR